MSRWRPVPLNCLYVIPDVHGMYRQLRLVLNRILPLRKSDGGLDRLVMLGDYIDRGTRGPDVVDLLIKLKAKYPHQLKLLKGNHEDMILEVIKSSASSDAYMMWMKNGGEETLAAYLKRADITIENPYLFPRDRIKNIIPFEHLDFFSSLDLYYEDEDFIFVHAGCDPFVPLGQQSTEPFLWDRSLYRAAYRGYKLPCLRTIVTGHNTNRYGNPLVTEKFMMLDCSYVGNLLVVEMNSMDAFVAKKGKGRLVRYKFA